MRAAASHAPTAIWPTSAKARRRCPITECEARSEYVARLPGVPPVLRDGDSGPRRGHPVADAHAPHRSAAALTDMMDAINDAKNAASPTPS
jgi:hypothetical protein